MSAESHPLEDRFRSLTGQVVDQMLTRGGNPISQAQQVGIGIVRVASDTDMDGWTSLTLDCRGEWGFTVAMNHSPVGSNLDNVLRTYSYIVDPNSRDSVAIDLDEAREVSAAQYIRENRERLLTGLAGSLETTLQSLQ